MSGIGKVGGNYAAIIERATALRKQSGGRVQSSSSEGREFIIGGSKGAADKGAGAKVSDALQRVSDLQQSSDKMVIDLASGRDVNIHNTMLELEKADIALKYTVQLRNRALSAYEELMRIQV